MARKVHWSSTLRDAFLDGCKERGLHALVLIRAVANRWNTYADVIGRALKVKVVCDDICDKAKFNTGSTRLRKYALSEEEWTILEQLYPILEVCFFFIV